VCQRAERREYLVHVVTLGHLATYLPTYQILREEQILCYRNTWGYQMPRAAEHYDGYHIFRTLVSYLSTRYYQSVGHSVFPSHACSSSHVARNHPHCKSTHQFWLRANSHYRKRDRLTGASSLPGEQRLHCRHGSTTTRWIV
jgi:hypothetical protein